MDLNKALGEECKAQLDAEFGEGNCTFIECDVANGDALRGNYAGRAVRLEKRADVTLVKAFGLSVRLAAVQLIV